MAIPPYLLQEALQRALKADVRLEFVEGIPTWECGGSTRHQVTITNILKSIEPGQAIGEPFSIYKVLISFPDGSFKQPDISIFGGEPEAGEEALAVIPMAIVEVLSPGFEHKDLLVGPPFYLKHGVLDVVVVDPRAGAGKHFTSEGVTDFASPCKISLQCGCTLTA